MINIPENKSKKYRLGYAIGQCVARTEYHGSESFLSAEDDEMMGAYVAGFADGCRQLRKDPKTLNARLDSERFEEFGEGVMVDVAVQENSEEHYGTLTLVGRELWNRGKLTLLYDDDEVTFDPEVGEIEIIHLMVQDDSIRMVVRLEKPIAEYLKKETK